MTRPRLDEADPGLLYLRVQALRRADRVLEAALLLRRAPRDAAALIDGDRWWDERRMVARRLLDAGMAKEAYALCDEHSAASIPSRVDAEFHAGWIALRFLNDPQTAARHFAAAAAVAANAAGDRPRRLLAGPRRRTSCGVADEAQRFYERAAAYPIAYYGQLARAEASMSRRSPFAPPSGLRDRRGARRGDARRRALYAARLDGFARSLAFDAARDLSRRTRNSPRWRKSCNSQRDGLASV